MAIVDDEGCVFGVVNVIDALVILFVIAFVAASTVLVLEVDGQPARIDQQTQVAVTVEVTGVQPYVADAIPEGPVESGGVLAVENKSVGPTEVGVRDQNGTLYERTHPRKKTVPFRVSLDAMTKVGEVLFDGKPLEVGRKLTLNLGPVTVKGTVTKLADEH